MKPIAILLGIFFVQPAFAYFYTLGCNSNYQPQVGKNTETVNMLLVNPEGFGDVKFVSNLNDYTYEVVWHKVFDTFYMTIRRGDQKLISATARVPSFEHNDTMVDVTLPDGTRRWIACGYKPK